LSASMQVMMGERIPGKGMRKEGSRDQGMKEAGRIREMLKGPEYTLKKRVLAGLTISRSMHFQPRALPDQGIGVNCVCARQVRGGEKGVRCRASCRVGAEVTRSVEAVEGS